MNIALVVVAVLLLAIGGVDGCDKGACQEYGVEPKFDSSDRPPSAAVLGRATWTMLHTTAAYLPDKLKPEEAAGFKDLVSSVVNLYPGDGARLIQSIIDDPIFRSEFDETDTAEHAQLVIWKLHNAVSAAVWPHRWPFPEFLGFQTDLFDLATVSDSEGDWDSRQIQIKDLKKWQRTEVLGALRKRWVCLCTHANTHTHAHTHTHTHMYVCVSFYICIVCK